MLSKLRRWLREGAILLVVLAGVIILLDVWRSPQMPAMFDSTPFHHAGCRPFAVGRGERHDHRAAFR